MIFLSIMPIGIGLIVYFKPDGFWKFTESWKSDSLYGPSGLYKFSTKFGGIMFCLAGSANLIIALFFK